MANAIFGARSSGLNTRVPLPRWLVLLQGIIAVAFGILLLAYPTGILLVLIVFLGVYWLINGIFVLASLISNRSDRRWKTLVGLLGVVAGILVLAYPLYSAVILPTLLAIIIGVIGLVIGIVHLVRGFAGAGPGAGIIGVVSIIFALILIAHPLLAALAVVMVIAVLAIIGGVLAIVFALRMPA
jgi:uncharacterized membrane protein HdeD (DUF308 family)